MTLIRQPEPASIPLGVSSSMLSDIGRKRLLPALVGGASAPHSAARALSVGILLYLVSVGIIAAVIVGVFFGIGFFLLVPPTEEMDASAVGVDHGSDIKLRLSPPLSDASSANRTILSIPIEPEIPHSAATAALPIVRPAPAAGQPSPIGDVPASDSKDPILRQGSAPSRPLTRARGKPRLLQVQAPVRQTLAAKATALGWYGEIWPPGGGDASAPAASLRPYTCARATR